MKHLFKLFLAVLMLAAAPAFASQAAPEAALDFVVKRNVGATMKSMALAAAVRTAAYRVIETRLGASQASELLSAELDALRPSYQDAWNQNLAAVYARHFSNEELASLTADGSRSPHAGKLVSQQTAVIAGVKELSTPVLAEYIGAALKNAGAKLEH